MDAEAIRPDEIRPIRERLPGMIASRLAITIRPPDPTRVPPEVCRIIDTVVGEFHVAYPDGLPPPPRDAEVTRRFIKRALQLLHEELAGSFKFGSET